MQKTETGKNSGLDFAADVNCGGNADTVTKQHAVRPEKTMKDEIFKEASDGFSVCDGREEGFAKTENPDNDFAAGNRLDGDLVAAAKLELGIDINDVKFAKGHFDRKGKKVKISKKSDYSGLKEKFNPLTAVMFAVLMLYSIMLITLVVWALVTSFKDPRHDYRLNPLGFPRKWSRINYEVVKKKFLVKTPANAIARPRQKIRLGGLFFDSGIYAVGCAFFNTVVPCVTAYLCARFNYRISKMIYATVLVTMVLPIVGSLPAELKVAKTLGFYDRIWGLWLMKANFLGLYFLVFYAAFKMQPMAFTEAAKIDGAGNMTVFLRIVFPLIRTTFWTIILIKFIDFWNDYQTPLLYLPSYPTVSYAIYSNATTDASCLKYITEKMAATMVMLIPTLTVFLIFHKRLFGNLTVGGIKG